MIKPNANQELLIKALRDGDDQRALALIPHANIFDISYGTLLTHHAVAGNCPKALAYLAGQGVDLLAPDYNHETPVSMAVEKDNLALLMLMHKANPSILTGWYQDGQTLLHLAAFYGAIHCARWLIDMKLPINELDGLGYPPIAITGMAEMVRLFIDKGADPTICLPNGKTILEHFEEVKSSWCKVEDLAHALQKAVADKSASHLKDEVAISMPTRKPRLM